jgi:hydroxymethylpyrimidine pyrophosphatase-like HAD family hydrolase
MCTLGGGASAGWRRDPMRLSAIALDYDGTIAHDGVLDPGLREAIAAARAKGIAVLLATGRILDDLRRVAGDLHFVDGIVAENGAVLHFPPSDYTSTLAPPVPAAVIEELRRRHVTHHAGACLVDAAAADAPALLDVIMALELPLVQIFNAGRVMLLPQGISKATCLQRMLETLRYSPHNVVAIGDAENDHPLLQYAGLGAAVAWGSQALCAAADVVIPDVAAYIRALAAGGSVPAPTVARRTLRLGYTPDGREFALAVRGRNVLVAGDAKSGKSWVAGLLSEQLILQGFCVCVIDPEGDYRSLEGLPRVTVLGGEDPPPSLKELQRAFRYADRSIVIDLSRLAQDAKIDYTRAVLPAINTIRRDTGLPHRIVLDEAHYFLQGADATRLIDLDANGYTIVTSWASRLPYALLAATEVMIVTRESNPAELAALREWCSTCAGVDPARWAMLARLNTSQAVALPITQEAGGDLRLFTLGPRLTLHVRHREKYVDVPVSDGRAFVFVANGQRATRRVRTLREFVEVLEHTPGVGAYLDRNDFSRWLRDVFGDHALAAEVRAIEDRHRVTPADDSGDEVATRIRARYDLTGAKG